MTMFWLIPVLAMALGFLPMPYGYYNLVRFVVSGSALYFAHRSFVKNKSGFVWVFVAMAILYNPIVPVYLYEKAIWTMVNILSSVIFFVQRR